MQYCNKREHSRVCCAFKPQQAGTRRRHPLSYRHLLHRPRGPACYRKGVCRRIEKPPATTGRRETSPQELLYRRRISSGLSRQEPHRLLPPTPVTLRVCKEGEREEVKAEFQHLTEKNKRALLVWGTLFLVDVGSFKTVI